MTINEKVSHFAWCLCALVAICFPPEADPSLMFKKSNSSNKAIRHPSQ
jgi:hypothetical protein